MFTTPLCTGADGEGEAYLGVVSGCRPGLVEVVEEPPADFPPVEEELPEPVLELPEPVLAELPAPDEVVVVVALVPAPVEFELPDPQPAISSSVAHAIAMADSDLVIAGSDLTTAGSNLFTGAS